MPNESPPILTDEKTTIKFWKDAVLNNGLSVTAPVYDEVLFVRILGGTKEDQVYEVKRVYANNARPPRKNEIAYRRFGKYIEMYESQMGQMAAIGMPLEEWPGIDVQRAALCKYLGVLSVEQLASLSDSALQAIGPGSHALRTKAQDWIKTAADNKDRMEAAAKERVLQSQIDNLKEQVNSLAEALNTLPAEQKAQVQERLRERGKGKAA